MENIIVELHSDNIAIEWIEKLTEFCNLALSENKHASRENMQVENWQEKPASLLFLLLKEKRFSKANGGLLLLINNQKIIAVSGYYASSFNSAIYILGVRSWVLKEFRFNLLIANQLLPYQLQRVKNRQAYAAIITFNEANKSFAKLIERSNRNPDSASKFFFGKQYPEIYKDMIFWKHPLKIKSVKQWVLIKNLKPNNFDWNSLRWNEETSVAENISQEKLK